VLSNNSANLSVQAVYQAVFASMPLGAVILDSSGAILDANPAALSVLGLSLDQLQGRTPYDPRWRAIHEDGSDFPGDDHPSMRALRTGQTVSDVVMGVYNPQTDAYRWINITATPLCAAPGQPPHMVIATFEDITRRKQAEQSLLEREELFDKAFRAGPAARAIIKMTDSRFVDANDSFLQLLEYTRAEIIGRTPDELHLYGHPKELPTFIRMISEEGRIRNYETVLRAKSGRLIQVMFSTDLIHVNGVEHHIVTIIDITAAKQAQRRLEERSIELSRANAELTRANRAKTEFIAMMSHELRTPLNGILVLSEALLEGIYGALNGPQSDRLNTIHESGAHLLGIINDILDLSKIETGFLDLRPAPTDVRAACQAAIHLVAQQADEKNQRLTFILDPEIDGSAMMVDELRLKQMLVNLLNNAVKFTPEYGRIELEVSLENDGEAIRFTVSDTGIGIAADKLEQIFQPFTQVDSSLSRQHGGTGLGLALVHKLAEQMGGGVGVKSTLGSGSRFWFTLPFIRAVPPSAAHPAGSDVPTQPSTPARDGALILIAEDTPSNLEALTDYLTAKGYRIVSASNGAEAIQRAQESCPDLILMDIQMPIMDGLEATFLLRANPATAATPIIALTALAMPGDRERCLAAGADSYLAKPVRLTQLAETIAALIRR